MEHAATSQTDREPGHPAAARFSEASSASTVVDNRPEASAQRRLADAIINSPRMAAQRKQLASMFGPAAQPAQRYRAINADAYQAEPDVKEAQAPFTHQSPIAALRDVGDPLAQYPVYSFTEKSVETRPDLLVADDDTVAVQAEAEPKEFYATAAVVEHANRALTAAGSKFVLKPRGHQLTVGKQTLSIVSPDLVESDVRTGGGLFGRYFTSVCRDFTTKVIGSGSAAHEAIFQKGSGRGEADPQAAPHRRKIDTAGATGSTAVRNVAASLSEPSATAALNKAFERNAVPEEDTETGIAYGTSASTGALQNNARGLGINEFAAPRVGEGYATYTSNADTDVGGNVLDYAAAHGPVPRANIWGYHFAGVVAQSDDGHDRITLENYNRGEAIEAALHDVLKQLLISHQVVVEQALARLQKAMPVPEVPIWIRVEWAYKAAHLAANQSEASIAEKTQKANTEYRQLVDKRNDSQAWFFQIYGSRQGQTFHERQAASGFFANPLTLRVGKVSEDVSQLQAALIARLNNVPGLVLGLQDYVAYAPMLQSGIRQVQARTTAQDAQAACQQVLTQLVRLRLVTLVHRATQLAVAEGVSNEVGDVFGAFDPLITGVDRKRNALGFYQLFERSRLDDVLTDLRTLRTAGHALTVY